MLKRYLDDKINIYFWYRGQSGEKKKVKAKEWDFLPLERIFLFHRHISYFTDIYLISGIMTAADYEL